ncbi:MAG TPA: carbohydrate-binding protein [Chitinophagaceae bacterium]|jgi:hypothetical protein|nr:carbohydrate-binding protein [Chitinophagaceae bacterium]
MKSTIALAGLASLLMFSCSKQDLLSAPETTATAPEFSSVDALTATTTAASIKVEAETYVDAYGVTKETTNDAGGGQHLGRYHTNDWFDLVVNVPKAGSYKVNLRVASGVTGKVQLRNTAGSAISTINVTSTGGTTTWKTFSSTVTLPAGSVKLRVFASTGGFNVNWLEFVGATTTADLTASTTPTTGKFANHFLKPVNGQIYLPNGLGISTLKPGDTVNIPAGTYSLIAMGAFRGTSALPIVIRNSGGLVTTKEIRVYNDARYFRFTGTGLPSVKYGFKVNGTGNSGFSANKATNFEVSNIEVTGPQVGIFIKRNVDVNDPQSYSPNYLFDSIRVLNNYLHDIRGEGMYLGFSGSATYQSGMTYIPVRMNNLEVAYNNVVNCDWDAIQVSNARGNTKIHHNTVTNFGRINMSSQQAGILLGGNTQGDVYDNVVKTGTGNGIQIFGYGTIRVYNNTVESTGRNGSSTGQESIFCNDYKTTPEVNPKQQMLIYNNTVKYPQRKGAIRVGAYNGNSLPASITNNKVLITAAPSNWVSLYVVSGATGSTISGNTLITQ